MRARVRVGVRVRVKVKVRVSVRVITLLSGVPFLRVPRSTATALPRKPETRASPDAQESSAPWVRVRVMVRVGVRGQG